MSDDPEKEFRKILGGLVPWDIDGFMSAHDFAAKLKKTPKDDWDHRRRGVAWDISDGPEEIKGVFEGALQELTDIGLVKGSQESSGIFVAELNSLEPVNQIGKFVRDQYDDRYTGTAHVVRFFEIGHFLRVHRRRLIKEDLIRETPEEDPELGVRDDINEVLLKALCELPYKGRRRQGPSGYAATLKLGAVLKRAKELLAEEEGTDD